MGYWWPAYMHKCRRDQSKFGLILIITGNVIDIQMSKFSVCAGYLAMGNGLFCIDNKTKQQNNEHIKYYTGQRAIIWNNEDNDTMRYAHLRNAVAINPRICYPATYEWGHRLSRHQDSCPRMLDFLIALIQSICLVTRLHSLHDRVLHGTYYIKLQFPRLLRNIHYWLNHLDVSPTAGTKPAQNSKMTRPPFNRHIIDQIAWNFTWSCRWI